jgi:hypothetical protein
MTQVLWRMLSRVHWGFNRLLWAFNVVLLVTISAVVVLAVVSVGALEAWLWYSRPPLIRGLAGTVFYGGVRGSNSDLAKAFNERVQSSFAIGLTEVDLRGALEAQGFDEQQRERGGAMSFLTTEGPFCGSSWVVSWKATNSGKVTEIRGFARRYCL